MWVHPTKSQNSLQEVDAQPNTKLKWPYFGAKQIMAPKKGGKMGHFGAFFLDADVKNGGIALKLVERETRIGRPRPFVCFPFRAKSSEIELCR